MYSANGKTLNLTIDHDVHPNVAATTWQALFKLDYHTHSMQVERSQGTVALKNN